MKPAPTEKRFKLRRTEIPMATVIAKAAVHYRLNARAFSIAFLLLISLLCSFSFAQTPSVDSFRSQMIRLNQQIKQSEFREAAKTAESLQVTAGQLMGASNPDVIRLGIQRGILLRSAGDYDQAAKQLQTTLKTASDQLGPRHSICGAAHNALGSIYRMQGKFADARQQYDSSLAILEAAGAGAEKDLAETYTNYCELLSETGQYVDSLRYGKKSLAINQRRFGQQHGATVASLNNVAMTQVKLGQWEQAETNLKQSLASSTALYGADHIETAL